LKYPTFANTSSGLWFIFVVYVFVQWYNDYFQLVKYGKFRETLVEAANPMIIWKI